MAEIEVPDVQDSTDDSDDALDSELDDVSGGTMHTEFRAAIKHETNLP